MECTLADIIDSVGCTYDFVNNLIRRDLLKTKLQRGIQGKARRFSRQNALEIGFLSILSGVGFGPSDASKQAQRWLKAEAKGLLGQWSIRNPNAASELRNAADPMPTVMIGDFGSLTLEQLANTFADKEDGPARIGDATRPATTLIILRPGEIVRRVDSPFCCEKRSLCDYHSEHCRRLHGGGSSRLAARRTVKSVLTFGSARHGSNRWGDTCGAGRLLRRWSRFKAHCQEIRRSR